MTVTTTLDRQYFNGDGTNKIFPFNFSYFNSGQIYVWLVAADGTLTPQMLTTDYSLVGGLPVVAGTVTMVVAPPVGTRLLVRRVVAETQPTSIRNQGAFFPEIHEDVFDRLTMLLQQVSSNQAVGVDRAIRIPDTDLPIPTLPVAATRAGKLLSFDVSGNPVVVFPDYDGVTGLAEALADQVDPLKGSAMIGHEGQTVKTVLDNVTQRLVDQVDSSNPAKGAALIGYNGGTVAGFLNGLSSPDSAVVPTIAALRLLNPTGLDGAFTLGYYASGDTGGGSNYRPVPSDTTSADNGGTIIVGLGGMRWYMIHDGTVNVEQFGVKPDGVTNMVPQVNAMIAAGIKDITFGVGPYAQTSGNISPGIGYTFRGIRGAGSTIQVTGTSAWVIRSLNHISGLTFGCSAQTAGNFLFILATSLAGIEYVTVEDVNLFHCKGFMTDENHASNVVTNLRIRNISSRSTKGPGVLFRDVFAFLEMRDIAMDYVGNVVAQNFTGFSIANNEGCYLDNCEMTGHTGIVAGTTSAQIGFNFSSCKAVYLHRSFADACGGRGFIFNACQYVRQVMCTASLCDDAGVAILSSSEYQASNLYVGGRRGIAGATAGIPGVLVSGSTRVQLGNLEAFNATGDGVNTGASASQLVINGGILSSNGGRGLVTGAGSVSVTTGTLFSSNITGNYSLATTVDILSGCQNSGGSLLNVVGPGAA